jgi:hypothetical protein
MAKKKSLAAAVPDPVPPPDAYGTPGSGPDVPDAELPPDAPTDAPAADGLPADAPPAELERVKFEWPDQPGGIMVLNDRLGYPGRKDVRFFGGFYITSDPDEVNALRARIGLYHDVYEVPVTVVDRTHNPSSRTPPPIPG